MNQQDLQRPNWIPEHIRVLAVPDEHLKNVIAIIRNGLSAQGWYNSNDEPEKLLENWCVEEEAYLKRKATQE